MLGVELGNRSHRYLLGDPVALASIKTTLLEGSTHGKLIPHTSKSGSTYYMYEAELGYLGEDKVVFMAEFEGKRYKIVIELHVMQFAGGNDNGNTCPPDKLIKVKHKPVSGATDYNLGNITVTLMEQLGSTSNE
jgi:hypothetical protein